MPDQYQSLRELPLLGVLAALGYTHWRTRKNGHEWFGKCPIHNPVKNTTSFSFDAEGKFKCFSCPAKGRGAIDLAMAIKQVGFREAVELLKGLPTSESLSVAATTSQTSSENDYLTENPPFAGTYEKFKVESTWLKARGLSPSTLDRFEVFEYRNDKRRSIYNGSVMLKIRRWSDGQPVAYLSRNTGAITPDKPKYRFPQGFQKSLELFGAVQLKKQTPLRVLYVLESPFAVMAFHQCGFAAVSPFGFSLSPAQVAIIAQLTKGVIYLPDRNKRDQIADSIERLSRFVWVKAPELPDGVEDPESLDRNQISVLA